MSSPRELEWCMAAPGVVCAAQVFRPRAAPERPYRVEHTAAGGQIPQPSRSVMSKFSEFIFGL